MIKKKKNNVENLKKGDKIKIKFGGSYYRVKVLGNNHDSRKIYVKFIDLNVMWRNKEIISYSGYHLADFDLLNN